MIPTPGVVLANLRIVGVFMALLAVLNLCLPARLRWREEMAALSLLNRQIFQVHSGFIILTIALVSALLLTCADALLEPTRLSRAVVSGLAIFWGARMLTQWFVYSPAVWRGNRFNTWMHYLFSAAWIYVTATFVAALVVNLGVTNNAR